MSPSPIRRPRVRQALVGAVAVLLLLGGCSRQKTPESYGGVEDNLVEQCAAIGVADTLGTDSIEDAEALKPWTTYCQCVFDELEKEPGGYSFDDFKSLNSKLSDNPTKLPEEFTSTYTACESKAPSA